jgi:hypothetical protein
VVLALRRHRRRRQLGPPLAVPCPHVIEGGCVAVAAE